jgi:hypothetical protein
MSQSGDYREQPGPGRGPGYTRAAGFGPQGEHPSTRPARVPPQFAESAPPRQDRPSYGPPQQPTWQPAQQAAPYGQPQAGYGPPYPQPQYAPQQYAQQPRYAPPPRQQWQQPAQPRKKHRVFLWVFLGIQVLFLIWIITGVASHPAGPTATAQAAQQCANNGWYPLFKSQADCQVHYAHALNEAGNVGKGLGVAFIVIFWVVADFFLGLGYGIYRLASRR